MLPTRIHEYYLFNPLNLIHKQFLEITQWDNSPAIIKFIFLVIHLDVNSHKYSIWRDVTLELMVRSMMKSCLFYIINIIWQFSASSNLSISSRVYEIQIQSIQNPYQGWIKSLNWVQLLKYGIYSKRRWCSVSCVFNCLLVGSGEKKMLPKTVNDGCACVRKKNQQKTTPIYIFVLYLGFPSLILDRMVLKHPRLKHVLFLGQGVHVTISCIVYKANNKEAEKVPANS